MANIINNRDSELSTCTSTTAISDVLGGIASFMLNYFKLKFPDNLFKETYISNSLNANVLARGIAHNQKIPYLGMEMEFTDEESILGPVARNHYPQQFIANIKRDIYYKKIFEDLDGRIRIYAMPKRVRATFNFLLRFQTHIQAINWVHFLNNSFELDGINYINEIRLPIEIPRYFVDRIRMKHELDPQNPEHNDRLRSYLRDNSLGGIRHVVNPTTGNKSYMYEYVANLLLQYPDQPSMDINEANLVVKDTDINFSINAEVSAPSGFILEIRDGDVIPYLPPTDGDFVLDFYIITDKIPSELEDGKKLIDIATFIAEVNTGIEEIDTSEILTKDLKQTIEAFNIIENFNITKLFEYKLYANNKLMSEEDYEIIYNEHKILNKKPDTNITYTLALYGDITKLNDINELILTNKRYQIKKLLYSYM